MSDHTPFTIKLGQKTDITDYIRLLVHTDRTMRRWRHEDKELVIHTLTDEADGMYIAFIHAA